MELILAVRGCEVRSFAGFKLWMVLNIGHLLQSWVVEDHKSEVFCDPQVKLIEIGTGIVGTTVGSIGMFGELTAITPVRENEGASRGDHVRSVV